ncbi:MAG: hypothetical protein J6D13_04835 [Clostridium sp.]|nr:hypothetical protein [Clostridium sp.]
MKLNKKVSLPVLLAAVFLFLSLLMFGKHYVSAEDQAEGWVRELYTVSRQLDLEEWSQAEVRECYDRRFGNRITEEAKADLEHLCLPYVILFQQTPAPVERSCVTQLALEQVDHPEKGTKQFRYDVWIMVTLEKGTEVLAPVEEQHYWGTVSLEKNGRFGWKLSGVTIE